MSYKESFLSISVDRLIFFLRAKGGYALATSRLIVVPAL